MVPRHFPTPRSPLPPAASRPERGHGDLLELQVFLWQFCFRPTPDSNTQREIGFSEKKKEIGLVFV